MLIAAKPSQKILILFISNISNVSLSLDTPPKLISSPPLTTPLLPRGASHAVVMSSFSTLATDADLKGHSSRRSSLANSPNHFKINPERDQDTMIATGQSANDTVASLNSSIVEDPRTLSHNTTVDPEQDFDAINNSVSQQVNAFAAEQIATATEYDECTEEDRIRAEICGDENAADIVNKSRTEEKVFEYDTNNALQDNLNESVVSDVANGSKWCLYHLFFFLLIISARRFHQFFLRSSAC